jgi:hypothetical protein
MSAAPCRSLSLVSWKDLYQAALFESDMKKLPERITDAETALVSRARELFYTSDDSTAERDSLDYALCALHSLRRSLKSEAC